MESASTCHVILLTLAGDVSALSRALNDEHATPDAVDERRRTGLHHAAARGLSDPMSALLASGADPDFRDIRGNTPLHLCGHGPTLALLIEYGADPRLTNVQGATAKDMMKRRGVPEEVVDRLQDYERRIEMESEVALDYEDYLDEDDDEAVERIALRQRRFQDGQSDHFATGESSTAVTTAIDQRLIDDDDDHRQDDTVSFLPVTCRGIQRRRRRRRYAAVGTDDAAPSRPLSVFHEFFLSLDAKTMIVVFVCVFILALFAAFYVTGVRMNYFEWWGERKDVVEDQSRNGEGSLGDNVKIVRLKSEYA